MPIKNAIRQNKIDQKQSSVTPNTLIKTLTSELKTLNLSFHILNY